MSDPRDDVMGRYLAYLDASLRRDDLEGEWLAVSSLLFVGPF